MAFFKNGIFFIFRINGIIIVSIKLLCFLINRLIIEEQLLFESGDVEFASIVYYPCCKSSRNLSGYKLHLV